MKINVQRITCMKFEMLGCSLMTIMYKSLTRGRKQQQQQTIR
jgi:hypothetical protein